MNLTYRVLLWMNSYIFLNSLLLNLLGLSLNNERLWRWQLVQNSFNIICLTMYTFVETIIQIYLNYYPLFIYFHNKRAVSGVGNVLNHLGTKCPVIFANRNEDVSWERASSCSYHHIEEGKTLIWRDTDCQRQTNSALFNFLSFFSILHAWVVGVRVW